MRDAPCGKEEMFPGLLGDTVRAFEKHTEADSTAIAVQMLVAFGNALGRGPHTYMGETRHGTNEYALVIGQTSRARKGDGKNIALRPFQNADETWRRCVASGLSSAEGVIFHTRDRVDGLNKKGEKVVLDEGAEDKRLLCVETEFGGVLRHFERQGNTLSPLLRDAWDAKDVLRTLTKNSPLRATGAHVSLIGHCTPRELLENLSSIEAANGFGNRFVFVATDRARDLPTPGRIEAATLDGLTARWRRALDHGRRVGELRWTKDAEAMWTRIYPVLLREIPGLIGALLARAEAHVLRLSMVYALMAEAQAIDVTHLESALALWDVSETSVRQIFAGRTGDDAADRILAALVPGQRMTMTELHDLFGRHASAGRLRTAIGLLKELGEVRVLKEETEGRPAVVIVRRPETGWPEQEPAGANGGSDARL